MNAIQISTLNSIKEEIKNGHFMTFDNEKKFVLMTGVSGSTLRSLVSKGMIEKLNHKFYTQFYAVTEKGEAV